MALALAILASPAQAARNITIGLDDYAFRSDVADQRQQAYDYARSEGVGLVRIDVSWRQVVGNSPPANPSDPADPSYNFAALDGTIRDAAAHGIEVMLTVYSAPAWAEGPNRPAPSPEYAPEGSWKPDPQAYGDFGAALATRYSGTFTPAEGGGPLPKVTNYEAWNEPNLWVYISPQYDGKNPVAIQHYRSMLNAFYEGVHGANRESRVLLGGAAPYGDPPGNATLRTRPLTFLKGLFCLSNRGEPLSCPNPVKFDTLGVHPINLSGGPPTSAVDPNDASSGDLPEVIDLMRTAESAGTLKGHHDVWVTEFWWESSPDGPASAIPGLAKHGRWIEQALYLFWQAGVKVAVQYQLYDDAGDLDETLQSGILQADGTPKPAATALRFPFVISRDERSKALVWGKAPTGGRLRIEQKTGGNWRKIKSLNVKGGRVFTKKLDLRGHRTYRATIGEQTSLPWKLRK